METSGRQEDFTPVSASPVMPNSQRPVTSSIHPRNSAITEISNDCKDNVPGRTLAGWPLRPFSVLLTNTLQASIKYIIPTAAISDAFHVVKISLFVVWHVAIRNVLRWRAGHNCKGTDGICKRLMSDSSYTVILWSKDCNQFHYYYSCFSVVHTSTFRWFAPAATSSALCSRIANDNIWRQAGVRPGGAKVGRVPSDPLVIDDLSKVWDWS